MSKHIRKLFGSEPASPQFAEDVWVLLEMEHEVQKLDDDSTEDLVDFVRRQAERTKQANTLFMPTVDGRPQIAVFTSQEAATAYIAVLHKNDPRSADSAISYGFAQLPAGDLFAAVLGVEDLRIVRDPETPQAQVVPQKLWRTLGEQHTGREPASQVALPFPTDAAIEETAEPVVLEQPAVWPPTPTYDVPESVMAAAIGPLPGYKSPRVLSRWIAGILVFMVPIGVLIAALPQYAHANLDVAYLFTLIIAVLYMFWVFRVFKNAWAFSTRGLTMMAAWAIGAYLVPIVNYFMPAVGLNEVWKASDPTSLDPSRPAWTARRSTPLLAPWWITLVVFETLLRLELRLAQAHQPTDSATVQITGACCSVSAILGIFLILGLAKRQDAKAAALAKELYGQ